MENISNLFKKYWIIVLGGLIIFSSILYLFKYAYDNMYIDSVFIVTIGLFSGISFIIGGLVIYQRKNQILGEILAGIGLGGIYSTIIYTAVTSLWNNYTVFVSIIAITIITSAISYNFNLRVLTSCGFAGALFSPFIIRATSFNINFLVGYILIINIAMIAFTYFKKWKELPIIAIILTFLLYISYYLIIKTDNWYTPFSYILSFYIIYATGLLFLTKKEADRFDGLNLYLSYINALWFGFWAYYIMSQYDLNINYPLILISLVFILTSILLSLSYPSSKLAIYSYLITGIVLLAVCGDNLTSFLEIRNISYVFRATIWLTIISLGFVFCIKKNKHKYLPFLNIAWLIIFIYWLVFAWDIENVRWFGTSFIPFINPPALVWIYFAVTGLVVSKYYYKQEEIKKSQIISSKVTDEKPIFFLHEIITLSSLIAIGGLLIKQISNLWEYYHITQIEVNIIYSIILGIYALVLFIWGICFSRKFYIFVADMILISVAIKVIFFDMSGDTSIYKVFSIFITGIVFIIIGYFNFKMQNIISKSHIDAPNT
ncbi:MAG: hypothetical protein A2096_06075 [Spirochaetes bacterium GWF1_41_5]|nr:MAG: hypothetical protein A2096_06075 [Spirochaetes bacterium GWF1_41_5]HBE04362.1 hypothetical protein [Spirochaetia bacterium]